jgi:Restriction endonuclease fold toxin 7
MTTRTQPTNPRRWVLVFLAAFVAVLATSLSSATASAATQGVAETRVEAHNVAAEVLVEPPEHIAAGQRLGKDVAGPEIVVATGVAADSGMAGVRAAGQTGEELAGIVKNTEHIPSLSGSAAYRIPDELNSSVLGEVKNVSRLSYTSQLRDFAAYASGNGLRFNLYVRGGTQLSGPLQQAVDSGAINLFRNLP